MNGALDNGSLLQFIDFSNLRTVHLYLIACYGEECDSAIDVQALPTLKFLARVFQLCSNVENLPVVFYDMFQIRTKTNSVHRWLML